MLTLREGVPVVDVFLNLPLLTFLHHGVAHGQYFVLLLIFHRAGLTHVAIRGHQIVKVHFAMNKHRWQRLLDDRVVRHE